MTGQPATSVTLTLALMAGLSGCAVRGAPSFALFGAYFPGWMFCALVGMAAAIVARVVFVATDLAGIVPFQLFVSSAIGLFCGLLAWLLWFGN